MSMIVKLIPEEVAAELLYSSPHSKDFSAVWIFTKISCSIARCSKSTTASS